MLSTSKGPPTFSIPCSRKLILKGTIFKEKLNINNILHFLSNSMSIVTSKICNENIKENKEVCCIRHKDGTYVYNF